MKQGNKYLKLIITILTIMVSSYIVYNILSAASSGVRTTQAVVYATSEGVSTEGFVVRQEAVIDAPYAMMIPTREEGEKVAAGAQVAISTASNAAWERQEKIQQLQENLAQLKLAVSYQGKLTSSSQIDAQISETSTVYAALLGRGQFAAAAETGRNLKSLVLNQAAGGSSTAALQSEIQRLETELGTMQAGAATDTAIVTVKKPGYYSSKADGFETLLTPDVLKAIDPSAFQALWEKRNSTSAPVNAAGRLIDSNQWYYATLVERRYLEDIHTGDTLTVHLAGDSTAPLKMSVVRVDRSGEETGLLVLTSPNRLFDVANLRTIKADVVFRSYEGLRIPKEAVCYDEESNTAGVYVLVSGKAVWKDVQLIYDTGDNYIAALDQSTTQNLWPEDRILLDTENLFDGKVVEST